MHIAGVLQTFVDVFVAPRPLVSSARAVTRVCANSVNASPRKTVMVEALIGILTGNILFRSSFIEDCLAHRAAGPGLAAG